METTNTTAEPSIETDVTGTSQEGSQDATSSTGGTSTGETSASAATSTEDGQASLTTDTETTQTTDTAAKEKPPSAQAKPAATENWKERYDGQTRAAQRLLSEKRQMEERLKALEQQYEPYAKVPKDELTKFLEDRSKVNLPAWNPQHQDHEAFRNAFTKYELFNELYDSESDPEVKTRLLQRFHQAVPQQMRQQIAAFQEHGRRERMRQEMDPEGYLQSKLDKMVDEKIAKFRDTTVGNYQENQQATQQVHDLLQKHPDIAASPEEMKKVYELFSKGTSMPMAFLMVRNASLEQRVSGVDLARKSVEEKERLLTSKASISRDPAVSTKVDLHAETVKIMRQRNIPAGDKRYLDIQDEVRRKYNSKA